MIIEAIEILENNLSLTLDDLNNNVANGNYDDLLAKYNLLIMISDGLVLINKDDKSCKVIAPTNLEDYVKNTDYATSSKGGVVKISSDSSFGICSNANNQLYIVRAINSQIDLKTSNYNPIVPSNLNYAVRSVYPITQTTITNPITVNTIYDLGMQTSVDITLPSGKLGDFIQFDFISADTATTLSITSTNGLLGYDLTPETSTIYTLYFDWGVISCDTSGTVNYGWRFNYSEYPITITEATSTT